MGVRHGIGAREGNEHQPQRLSGCDESTEQDVGGKQQGNAKPDQALVEEGLDVPSTEGKGRAHSGNQEEGGQAPLVHHVHHEEHRERNVTVFEQPEREHAEMEPNQQPEQNYTEPVEVMTALRGCFWSRRHLSLGGPQ